MTRASISMSSDRQLMGNTVQSSKRLLQQLENLKPHPHLDQMRIHYHSHPTMEGPQGF